MQTKEKKLKKWSSRVDKSLSSRCQSICNALQTKEKARKKVVLNKNKKSELLTLKCVFSFVLLRKSTVSKWSPVFGPMHP